MTKQDLRIKIRLAIYNLGRDWAGEETAKGLRNYSVAQLKAWLAKLRQEQRDKAE